MQSLSRTGSRFEKRVIIVLIERFCRRLPRLGARGANDERRAAQPMQPFAITLRRWQFPLHFQGDENVQRQRSQGRELQWDWRAGAR